MTYEEDRVDLARHEKEIAAHQSFNYALLDEPQTAILGSVCIDPPERAGRDGERAVAPGPALPVLGLGSSRVSVCRAMLDGMVVDFETELWLWDARRADTWAFVSLPAEASDEISALAEGSRRGFGSVRVRVTIGASAWATSIFPARERGCYVLPVKRAVREAEGLEAGDVAKVTVELVDL